MSDALVIAIIAIGVLAAAGVFAVAFRRPTKDDWEANAPAGARKADKGAIEVSVPEPAAETADGASDPTPLSGVAVITQDTVAAPAEVADDEVSPAEIVYEETPADEQAVTRRNFLKKATFTTFFVWLATMGAGYLSFMWPKVKGGFGADIDAGDATEILSQVLQADGSVTPLFIPEGRAYVIPLTDEQLAASEFEDTTVASGLVALFQTCVHLGCRVPWCSSSQGFECPCHGSKYTSAGEYFAGPAPRNLDRFIVSVNDDNRLIISTGSIVATPRAQAKGVEYPQGPSCI